MYWRNVDDTDEYYSGCEQLSLPQGILVSHLEGTSAIIAEEVVYQQFCIEERFPVLSVNVGLLNLHARPLPIIEDSWSKFTSTNQLGAFSCSVVSVIYSISILAVITWFLTVFVVTNCTIRAPVLLKVSSVISSVYFLIVIIKSIFVLNGQQNMGYFYSSDLLHAINTSTYLNVIDLVAVVLLLFNQVQTAMRVFLRQKDKRAVFYVGGLAAITTQIIWAISKFHRFHDEELNELFPAFVYLFKIAMSACYASLITVHLLSKTRYIIANRNIWLSTLLTLILLYTPVAFFIADVSNIWVFDLAEIFSIVAYLICVVMPWEWYNKFDGIMKVEEKDGVLGRKFYEDEVYDYDNYDIFRHDDNDHFQGNASGNDYIPRNGQESINSNIIPTNSRNLYGEYSKVVVNAVNTAKNVVLGITDTIIAAGFAIPRSMTNSPPSDTANDISEGGSTRDVITTNHRMYLERMRMNNPMRNPTSNRRDTYVYATKQVVINDE